MMLMQLLLDVIFFLFKITIWALLAVVIIPLGILILFMNIFPDFAHDGNFWFWLVFVLFNGVAYYFLWKPILWTVSNITMLFEAAWATRNQASSESFKSKVKA